MLEVLNSKFSFGQKKAYRGKNDEIVTMFYILGLCVFKKLDIKAC